MHDENMIVNDLPYFPKGNFSGHSYTKFLLPHLCCVWQKGTELVGCVLLSKPSFCYLFPCRSRGSPVFQVLDHLGVRLWHHSCKLNIFESYIIYILEV